MFWETDASMVEINPLITTPTGEVLALDAKVSFDDNALFRHPEIVALRDLNEEDPKEIEASKHSSTTSRSTATSPASSTAPASP
jgi:succinyl-CoA synthetase beta subunit